MTLRIFRRTSDGSGFAIDSGLLSGLTSAQLTSMQNAGYTVTNLTPTDLINVVKVHGFDPNTLPGGGQQITLEQRIPLTVQGASEDFITDRMQQVQNRDDTNANMLNLQVIQSKNEILAKLDT